MVRDSEIRGSWAVGGDASSGQVHLGDLIVLIQSELAVLGFERVDVNGSV